ncbi:uncharacterized protein LOC129956764 [Argiope bruennichi]|uniref:uncharacterized protein LOC129956764 n=1 Tax=Argiope bruennichi TaxID=94029 RepID=UPI0024949A22|nr:uncharacterized protein LOC129956764 [Argiope bruennichi]
MKDVIEDVFTTITGFRGHKFAFTTDIEKMYRQILIESDQCDLLRILWKTNFDSEPTTYKLKTVTYGMSCALFLAIRTLKQLTIDENSRFPLTSEILLHDTYMDDIVSGCSTLEGAKELQRPLIEVMQSAGLKLHK